MPASCPNARGGRTAYQSQWDRWKSRRGIPPRQSVRSPPPRSKSVLCEYPSQQIGYVPLGPSPMHEALCRPAGLTSYRCISDDGPPSGPEIIGSNGFKSDWLATVRGRAGWAWDRILFFGTGG